MSKSETPKSFGRRSFIGASAALGVAGFALPQIASAAPPPDKFKGKKPMWPAPSQVQAVATAPPLAALVLNKAPGRQRYPEAFQLGGRSAQPDAERPGGR